MSARTVSVRVRIRRFCAALLLGALGGAAHADDYNAGLRALEAGDAARTLALWRPLAEAGDIEAQFGLGVMYNDGLGVEQNYTEANYWFLRAAERGHAPSQFNLGNAYKNGTGLAADAAMAVRWWRKAAEQGFGPAQFNLGSALLEGSGVARDRSAALDWYKRAAAGGHPQARQYLDRFGTEASADPAPGGARAAAADRAARAAAAAPSAAAPATGRPTEPAACTPWLHGASGTHTVQLLSSRTPADAVAYAQQFAVTDTAVCSYRVKGSRWHALLYGRFPSMEAARAALAQLPAPVRARGAYVRRIAEIETAVARSQ